MEYVFLILFFACNAVVGFIVGIYMIYSGVMKGKGVVLPECKYLPFFVQYKKGDEEALVIGGVLWSLFMLVLLFAAVLALAEFITNPHFKW